jgi:Derlin-2/3
MGPLNLDFIFHIYFMSRYSRMLEETHFRNRTKSFIGLLIYAMTVLLILSPLTGIPFLGSPLSFTLVYIYSRLNPDVRMSFLGLFIFRAPYLPWVLLGFSVLLNSQLPMGDLMGVVVGHGYYFYEICRRDGNGDFWEGVKGLRQQMRNRLA